MLQLMPWFTLLAAVTLAACAFPVQAAETVTITSSLASKGPFTAQLLKPSGAGPFPAVVALHGCGGLLNSRGQLRSREADWAERFLAAGYAVLFPDSFTARGMREICTGAERSDLSQGSRRRCAGGRGVAGRAALRRQAQAGPDRLVARGHGGAVGAAAGLHGQSAAVQDGDRVLSGLPPDRPARGLASERPADPDDRVGRRLDTAGALPRPRQAHRLPLHRVRQRLPRLRRAQLARCACARDWAGPRTARRTSAPIRRPALPRSRR